MYTGAEGTCSECAASTNQHIPAAGILSRRLPVGVEQRITEHYDVVSSVKTPSFVSRYHSGRSRLQIYLYLRDAEHPSTRTAAQETYEKVQYRRHPR
jgi:hypothetical protein